MATIKLPSQRKIKEVTNITAAGSGDPRKYSEGDIILYRTGETETFKRRNNTAYIADGDGNHESCWTTIATGGATTIGALTDVNVTGVADNKILKYQSSSSTWIIADDNAGSGSADNLGNHEATEALDMKNFNIKNVKEIQLSGIDSGANSTTSTGKIYQFSTAPKLGQTVLDPGWNIPSSENSSKGTAGIRIGPSPAANTSQDLDYGANLISRISAGISTTASLQLSANGFDNASIITINPKPTNAANASFSYTSHSWVTPDDLDREGIELRVAEASNHIAAVSIKSRSLNANDSITTTKSPELRMYNPKGYYTAIKAHESTNQTGDVTFELPSADGSSGQFLKTDGAGALTWAAASGNVQSDWNAASGDAQILNKPTIPSGNAVLDWTADQGATNIHSGNYTDTTYTVGDGGLTQKNFTTALNTKLAGIAANAEVNVVTNLGSNATNSALEITSSTGDDASLPAATTSAWGVMTDEDKTKLDTLKETINLVVTVGSGVYFIDGVKVSSINLQPGFTYKFDQSDGTNDTHPLRLAKEPDAANSSSYTTGVTTAGTPGSAGAFTQIVVNNATPLVLYTYCTNHSGMGQEVVCGAPKYQGGVVDITTSPPPTIMSAHVSNYIFYRAGNDTTNNQTNDVRIDVATQFPKGATISIKSALNGDYSSPVQDTVKVSVYKSSTDLSSTNPFIVINGNANDQSVGSHQNFTIQKGKKLDLFYDGSKFVLVGFFQGA